MIGLDPVSRDTERLQRLRITSRTGFRDLVRRFVHAALDDLGVEKSGVGAEAVPASELLSRLERGEINVNDVLSRLRKAEDDHE